MRGSRVLSGLGVCFLGNLHCLFLRLLWLGQYLHFHPPYFLEVLHTYLNLLFCYVVRLVDLYWSVVAVVVVADAANINFVGLSFAVEAVHHLLY